MPGGALINLGELSKPATTLIEKVSDAVGSIAKPWHMVRLAKAEAKVEVIRAHSRVEVSEIEERALVRMVREEGKKQENIENITAQAIPHLSPAAKPESIEDDWLTHFFDRCHLVSDAAMQSLWARILAGEANTPTRFSRRTVDVIATFDKADAEYFVKLCTFVWLTPVPQPVVWDFNDDIYKKCGITFAALTHLDTIGLVRFETFTGFSLECQLEVVPVSYYGIPLTIAFPEASKNTLQLGKVIFTSAGQQLVGVCAARPSAEFLDYIIDKWIDAGFVLSCPLPRRRVAWR